MTGRKFGRAFRIEAVRLVTERGVSVARACRDLELAEGVLRRWMWEPVAAPAAACPRNGQTGAGLAESAALGKEVARLRAERDILRTGEPCAPLVRAQWRTLLSRGRRHDVRLRCQAPPHLAGQLALRGDGGLAFGLSCLAPSSGQRPRDPGCEARHRDDKSFRASDRTYGARRVRRDVLEDGLACGLHRIERPPPGIMLRMTLPGNG